jgi:hypothetical protein
MPKEHETFMHTLAEQAQSFAEIQDYLVRGAIQLFGGYGVPVEHSIGGSAVAIQGPAVMSVIGYAAPTVRGALLVLTSHALVAALQPEEIRRTSPTEALLRDVLGEFCNMLLGRVNNQLAARNVALLVATPTTIFGVDLDLPVPRSGLSAWHRFASGVGDIFVRLDATFEPEFSLAPAESRVNLPSEGELVLF